MGSRGGPPAPPALHGRSNTSLATGGAHGGARHARAGKSRHQPHQQPLPRTKPRERPEPADDGWWSLSSDKWQPCGEACGPSAVCPGPRNNSRDWGAPASVSAQCGRTA